VVLCAFACFTILPALIVLIDRRKLPASGGCEPPGLFSPGGSHPPLAGKVDRRDWLPGLARRPRWVLAGGLLLVALLAGFAFRVRYDHNLLKLQANGLEPVRWEKTLTEHTAGASWHALSHTATRDGGLLRPLLDVAHPPRLLTALEEQLSEFRDALARLPWDGGAERVKSFERRMVADLADDLRRLRDVSSPAPIRLDHLPESLRQ